MEKIIPEWMKKHSQFLKQELEEKSGRTNYVQRDLEDQIEEEYRAQGREYQRTDTNNSDNMSITAREAEPIVVIQDVLDLLKRGYTRLAKEDKGYGSIERHYSLTPNEIKELFRDPRLKAKKTMPPKRQLNIVDRDEPIVPTEAEVEDFVNEVTITIGGEVIPVQDVLETSTGAEDITPVVNSTSREELFS